jgi:hypothetical protein
VLKISILTALKLLPLVLILPQAARAQPVAVTTADMDGEAGCPACTDLVIAERKARAVVLRFGNGDGSFDAPISLPLLKPPKWVATGDCDGDGDEDIFAVGRGSLNLSVFVNQQVQGSPRVFLPAAGSPSGVDRRATFVLARDELGNSFDFDDDGASDLVVSGKRAVTTLRGDGACGFTVLQSDIFANKPMGVAVADFDGVGGPDIAVADQSALPTFQFGSAVAVLLNDSSGGFPSTCVAPSCVQYGARKRVTSVAAVDLNLDGPVDLLFTNLRGGTVFNPDSEGLGVLFGLGAGTFGAAVLPGSHGKSPRQVVAGDVTGDGTPDAVVVNRRSGTIASVAGPVGTFLETTDAGRTPVSLAVGQLDTAANTDLDVVVARHRSRDLAVCLGGGDGSFSCSALP